MKNRLFFFVFLLVMLFAAADFSTVTDKERQRRKCGWAKNMEALRFSGIIEEIKIKNPRVHNSPTISLANEFIFQLENEESGFINKVSIGDFIQKNRNSLEVLLVTNNNIDTLILKLDYGCVH